ncbi:MAG: hypothetical protein HYS08_09070 [Chlamydiae bacterium]|nr:hypothetical protein [Chlamydiota bacterium]MBI3265513.1 hypothetical protein [Chlamydiota bacterium]
MKKIFENMRRLGIKMILPMVADATKIKNLFKIPFDRILVDVPCSNCGVFAKRVEAR